MPEALDQLRRDIEARIAELEPLAAELEQLRQAHSALERVGSGEVRGRTRRFRRAETTETPNQAAPQRAARGERLEQVRRVVEARPEVRPSELAEELGISRSQASSYLRRLREERSHHLVASEGGAPQEADELEVVSEER